MSARDSLLRWVAVALLLVVCSHIVIRTAAVLVAKAQQERANG